MPSYFSNASSVFKAFNDALTGQKGYGLWNSQLGYRSDTGWSMAVIGRNLSDEVYYTATADFSPLGVNGAISQPLTVDFRVGYNF